MDPFSLDEADTPERQAALAAALRRREDLGQLFQLTGDKVLAPLGQNLMSSADRGEQRLDTSKQRRLQLNLEAKKDSETRAYQEQGLGLERERLNLARQTASREQNTPVPTAQGYLTFDRRTGKFTDPTTGQPVQGAVMPVKFGDSPGDEQGALNKMNSAIQRVFSKGGAAGKNLERQHAFERLQAAGEDAQGNPRAINPSQLAEFYTNFNTALGGSQSLGALEHLLPRTVQGDWAKALEWVTSNPHDAGAQAFVANVLEIAKREKAVIKSQNLRQLETIAPSFAPTLKKYPSARKALEAYGVTEDMLDPETFLPKQQEDPIKAGLAAESQAAKKPVKYLVRPDGKVRVPVFADGSKGAEEPNQ